MIFLPLKGCKAFLKDRIFMVAFILRVGKNLKICDETSITLAKVWYFSKDGMMDRKTCQNMSVNCAIH